MFSEDLLAIFRLEPGSFWAYALAEIFRETDHEIFPAAPWWIRPVLDILSLPDGSSKIYLG